MSQKSLRNCHLLHPTPNFIPLSPLKEECFRRPTVDVGLSESAEYVPNTTKPERSSSSFPGKVTIVTKDSVGTLDHARPSYHRHLLSYVSPSISPIFDVAGRVGFLFPRSDRLVDELSLYCSGSWIIWLGKHGGEHFPVGRHATQPRTWCRNGMTGLGLGRQTGWMLVPHL